MPAEKWVCESCNHVNYGELKGVVKCEGCGAVYVVQGDEAPTQRSSEQWLGMINQQLVELNRNFADAAAFREREKRVLGEIETILRRAK